MKGGAQIETNLRVLIGRDKRFKGGASDILEVAKASVGEATSSSKSRSP